MNILRVYGVLLVVATAVTPAFGAATGAALSFAYKA